MRNLIIAAVAATQVFSAQSFGQKNESLLTKEFGEPWMEGTRPRDPYADQKGRVWFVGQEGNYIGRIEPGSGAVRRFEIDPGTNPHNLVVDAHGTVWFTGNRNNRIVKMDPESGKITTYMIPDPAVRDPHTMIFDKKGNAWFTAQNSGFVGHFSPSTGKFQLFRMEQGSKPYGIVLDSKGQPYFDLFGTNKIGTIDPVKMEFKEIVLPDAKTRPRRIAITSDDVIWYGDYTRGYLGRLDPRTGKAEEFKLPGGAASLPYGMVVDDRDRVWVAETGSMPIKLVAFDTKKRVFDQTVTVGGGQTPNNVRHMMFDPATKTIWYGQDRGFIGSVKLPTIIVP